MPTIRAITRDVAKDDNRFSAIVLGVVKSPQFQMRKSTTWSAPERGRHVSDQAPYPRRTFLRGAGVTLRCHCSTRCFRRSRRHG